MLEWYIDDMSNLIIREVLMLQNNEEVDNNIIETIKIFDIVEWKNKTENMKNHIKEEKENSPNDERSIKIKEENAIKIINAWKTYIKLIHDKKDWSMLASLLLEAVSKVESFIMCMSL